MTNILVFVVLYAFASSSVYASHSKKVYHQEGQTYKLGWIDMKAFQNTSLDITPLKEEFVSNPSECSVFCMLEGRCKSINVKFSSVHQLICQLLSGDKFSHAFYFSNKTIVVHYAIKVSMFLRILLLKYHER